MWGFISPQVHRKVIEVDLKDLIDGITYYVNAILEKSPNFIMVSGVIESHDENGYNVKINKEVYNNIKTINNLTFEVGETVRLISKTVGNKYVELIILGKVTS